MTTPLPVGNHVLHLHTIYGDPSNPIFEGQVTHNITVVPGHGRAGDGATAEDTEVEPTTWGSIKAVYR